MTAEEALSIRAATRRPRLRAVSDGGLLARYPKEDPYLFSGEAAGLRAHDEDPDLSGEAADRGAALAMGRRLSPALEQLASRAQLRSSLPPVFRALIADLVADLAGLRSVLLASVRPEDGPMEDDISMMAALRSCGERQLRLLDTLRVLAAPLDDAQRTRLRSLARMELGPLFKQSPFFHRAHQRPRPPVWDGNLLRYLFSEHLLGPTRFDRYLHAWLFRSALGRGVRGRERAIRLRLEARITEGRPLRVASIAAGPCLEIRRALATCRYAATPIEIVLFDDNPEALVRAVRETQAVLRERPTPRNTVEVRGACTSTAAFHRPKPGREGERRRPLELDGRFDLVLAPTLLDEAPDPSIAALLEGLETRLAPGGEVLMGGLGRVDGLDWLLEEVLGWRPARRAPGALSRLARANLGKTLEVTVDEIAEGESLILRLSRSR